MKKVILLLGLLISALTFAQESVNAYKYVVIADQFDFQKEADQYQLNSLTKFLFEKYGFTAYLESEAPLEVLNNPCDYLRAKVVNNSNMFTTKLVVKMINCKQQTVVETSESKSKEKDFQKAYHEAIRENFKDIEALNYTFTPSEKGFQETTRVAVVETPKKVVKKEVATSTTKTTEKVVSIGGDLLIAKPFLGVNYKVYSGSDLVMTLLYTPQKDIFIVKDEDAIVYKLENDVWMYFKTDGSSMNAKAIAITFEK